MTDSSEPDDPNHIGDWPLGRNKIETARHVHAFGMIALNSAMLEEILFLLLVAYLPMEREAALRLVSNFNNRERADWLREIVRDNEEDAELAGLILEAVRYCDICFDNRNMLVHALYAGTDEATASMMLTKRSRNDPLKELRFAVSTQQLRKIADEIGNALNFMVDLWFCKTHRDNRSVPWTLPEKPPQPDKLTIPPPPANP